MSAVQPAPTSRIQWVSQLQQGGAAKVQFGGDRGSYSRGGGYCGRAASHHVCWRKVDGIEPGDREQVGGARVGGG